MARLLQRLGAFSVRRRRTVLASWLVALGVMAALSLSFAGEFTGNFSIPGTESQKANDLIQARTPGADADAPSGRVVFAAPARPDARLRRGQGRRRTRGRRHRTRPGRRVRQQPVRVLSGLRGRTDRLHQRGLLAPGGPDDRVAEGRRRSGHPRPRSRRGCRSSTPAPPPEGDRAARRAFRSANCSASASPSSCWRSPSAR